MKLDIITLFPAIFESVFSVSIIKRAVDNKLVDINIINLRDFAHDTHRTVDDRPYGGGAGMVMKPEPIFEAVETLRGKDSFVILLSPQGKRFTQSEAKTFSGKPHLILICGHYEGVDERVSIGLADAEVSIGDYILTSGNLPAMVVVDAVTRLLPGVLGSDQSVVVESFNDGLLEYPQYTRPEVYKDMRVPGILLSGNHEQIGKWRDQQARIRTELRASLGGASDETRMRNDEAPEQREEVPLSGNHGTGKAN